MWRSNLLSSDYILIYSGDPIFDYLVDMPIRSLTLERKNGLQKRSDEKLAELEELKKTPLSKMWLNDITELEEGIKKYESDLKKAEVQSQKQRKATSKKKYINDFADNLGEVVAFKIPSEPVKVKREKKEAKEPKAPRVKKEEEDEPGSLAARLKKKRKSTTPKKAPKKNPWETDSEEEEDISDFSGISDEGSDGDFRPSSKKAKISNGNGIKMDPDDDPVIQLQGLLSRGKQ